MDSSCHTMILITIFLSFILSSNASPPPVIPKLVADVCRQLEYSTFCIEVFQSDPRTETANDLISLTKLALDIAASNTTSTRTYIQDSIKKSSNSTPSESVKLQALKDCNYGYEQVIGEFHDAIREVEGKDYNMANYFCEVAPDGARDCNETMADAKLQDSTIDVGYSYVTKFSLLGCDMTDLLDR